MRLRSLLYVPAHSERFVSKAHDRGADAVILDLEDAVEEGSKNAARSALESAVPQVRKSGSKVYVRVNTGTRMREDARAAQTAGADGIVLPKARDESSIDELIKELLPGLPAEFQILAIIEDATGLLNAQLIARHPRVVAISLGAEDFATETGSLPIPEVVRLPKLMVHYAAKAEGKISLGMLRSTADFTDTNALEAAAAEAARFGFDGASCIHPSVVSILNEQFSPSEEAVSKARRIVNAAARAMADGKGAFMLDNEFVDLPVVNRAHAVLAKAGKSQ